MLAACLSQCYLPRACSGTYYALLSSLNFPSERGLVLPESIFPFLELVGNVCGHQRGTRISLWIIGVLITLAFLPSFYVIDLPALLSFAASHRPGRVARKAPSIFICVTPPGLDEMNGKPPSFPLSLFVWHSLTSRVNPDMCPDVMPGLSGPGRCHRFQVSGNGKATHSAIVSGLTLLLPPDPLPVVSASRVKILGTSGVCCTSVDHGCRRFVMVCA